MSCRVTLTDFGWRLHGRNTGAIADHSFDLQEAVDEGRRDGDFLRRHGRALGSLESCLQCGACTATCDLAGQEGLFPRRQVTYVRLGLAERAADSPEIWQCYACTECTARCPSGVRPSAVMSALRQALTERNAWPQCVARAVNSPRWFWAAYALSAAVLAVLVLATGSFRPGPGPIEYAGMLPTAVVIPVFSVLTLFPVLALGVSTLRAVKAWPVPAQAGTPGQLRRAVASALPEIAAQRRLGDCGRDRPRAWAHRAVVAGFVGLAVVSGVVALLMAVGRAYPLSMGNPLKIASNLFAAFLVGGAGYFLVLRWTKARRGEGGTFFDWVFAANVFLAAVTGVATELLRVGDVRQAAYPVFFLHLIVVLVLIVTLPYSKLAHVVYRVTALVGQEYAAAGPTSRQPGRHHPRASRARGRRPDQEARRPGGEATGAPAGELSTMGWAELSALSDEEIERAYYSLRDDVVERGGARHYPGVQRLYLTALEREKDRREVRALVSQADKSEWETWYTQAADRPCTWWVENHLVVRRALSSCLHCGMCASVCPAAEHFPEYDPRCIVDAALSGDEDRLVELLKSDLLWYCVQCGSCNSRCPHANDIMGTVNSLRMLAQLKGYHLESVRGRQQYFGRHLWGGNLWNRACSLYFRDAAAADHPEFGPRYAQWQDRADEEFLRVGGQPDMDGTYAGRKVAPETLQELRSCIRAGGTLVVWDRIEQHAAADAARLGIDIDQYYDKVRSEG